MGGDMRLENIIDRNTADAFDHLVKAATLLHDTGVIESDTLDKAVCFAQDAIDMVERFRQNELEEHL